MLGTRLAGLFAPVIYLFALIFGLCWLFGICGPLEFLWSGYLWLSKVMIENCFFPGSCG